MTRSSLITGGKSGIGLRRRGLFVSKGARIHAVGIDEPKLAAVQQELGEDKALCSVADVTDEKAVRDAVAHGVDRSGRFDIVISNAGISGAVSEIVHYPSDTFARTLSVHVLGAFHILKHTIPTSRMAAASSSPRALSALWGSQGCRGTSPRSTVRSD